ncbi:MAG TPA: FliH/SctL family protein [Soehngenia sp.]|mgnify:CR=1 FL=1|nr:FliH/SctL family protein [Soehngenia sp.]HPP31385.1 FliH/SctL family protein [Soehngenia sp.]
MESSYRVIKKHEIKLDNDTVEVKEVNIKKTEVDLKNSDFDINKEDDEELLEALSIKQKIIDEAETEREFILQKANEELENIKKSAFEEGYNQGYEKGYIEGKERAIMESESIKLNAIKLVKNAQKESEDFLINFREEIIKLAATIAEKIANIAIDTSEENIMNIIYPILEEIENATNVIITVNPSKYEILKKNLPSLKERYKQINFSVLKDADIEINGCIIESGNKIIDAQFSNQIISIVNELINSGE